MQFQGDVQRPEQIQSGIDLFSRVALALLRGYKLAVSPLFAGSCRYVPSCSDYMAGAIRRHGLLAGTWMGTRRLCRCHPFGGSGFDPVPEKGPGPFFSLRPGKGARPHSF